MFAKHEFSCHKNLILKNYLYNFIGQVKKPKIRKQVFFDDQTDDEQQIQSIKV